MNLEKKIAPTFLTALFIGGELFHQSLTSFSENWVPRKEETRSFSSARILLARPRYPHNRLMPLKSSASAAVFSVGHVAPEAKKPLRKIKGIEQLPPLQLSRFFSLTTGRQHLHVERPPFRGCCLPTRSRVWWHTMLPAIEEVWARQKQRILVFLKKIKEKCSLTPTTTKPFIEKSTLLSCNKVKG